MACASQAGNALAWLVRCQAIPIDAIAVNKTSLATMAGVFMISSVQEGPLQSSAAGGRRVHVQPRATGGEKCPGQVRVGAGAGRKSVAGEDDVERPLEAAVAADRGQPDRTGRPCVCLRLLTTAVEIELRDVRSRRP